MVELGPATEDEMVFAFVRAEIDSHRHRDLYSDCLAQIGCGRDLIDGADLADAAQNAARKELLTLARGYGNKEYLFIGFPSDARWRRVRVELHDFDTLRCANFPTWTALSDGTRLVSVAAQNVGRRRWDEGANHRDQGSEGLAPDIESRLDIEFEAPEDGLESARTFRRYWQPILGKFEGPKHSLEIARAIQKGVVLPEMIAAEAMDGSLIIIEGHARATAYLVAGCTGNVQAIVGSSPSIREWLFY
ncbi:MAG TPA: hypothetical protein VN924_13710 [Bryobacteraceae bacterium]|nr:hypothetical protein [Bryobacteraceae bacterium]